jgi:cytidylate kinase
MAKNFLTDYIQEKIKEFSTDQTIQQTGVITISRQYGCPGKPVSMDLAKALGKPNREWKVVDKEVVKQAADELSIPDDLAEKLFKSQPNRILSDLFSSFSTAKTPTDIEVKKTIARILRTTMLYGNVIVLGQGGVMLARDIRPSLHVFLHANPNWRKKKVRVLENLNTEEQALERIKQVDEERVFLRNYYGGETLTHDVFDISLNCEHFSEEEIVQIVLDAAKKRGIS